MNSFNIFIIFGATSTNTESIYKIFFMLNYLISNFVLVRVKDEPDPRKWAFNYFTTDSVVKKS